MIVSHVLLFVTLWTIQSMEFSRLEHWSGYLSLRQGIFPTQGSNPGLPHCRWIFNQLSHREGPKILEWVAYPFSNGYSLPRNLTGVCALQADSLPTELSRKPQFFSICPSSEMRSISVTLSLLIFFFFFFYLLCLQGGGMMQLIC